MISSYRRAKRLAKFAIMFVTASFLMLQFVNAEDLKPIEPELVPDYPPTIAYNDHTFDWRDPGSGKVYRDINYFVLRGNSLTMTKENGIFRNDINWREEPTWETDVATLPNRMGSHTQYGFSTVYRDGSFVYTPFDWVFEDPLFNGLSDTIP